MSNCSLEVFHILGIDGSVYDNCTFKTLVFDAWTIPCLYSTCKYLRIFAIKADVSSKQKGEATFNTGFEDDVVDEEGGNEKLEDGARQINKVFGLCLSDRAPLHESRKWALYYIASLLFKTYFKLNSASLSRTILKTLAVYKDKGDMPALEAFPKAQRVTFKYYEGVLFFLEENYVEVGLI